MAHPENAGRLEATLAALEESPYQEFLDLTLSRLATNKEIAQVHDPAYIDHVFSLEGKTTSLDTETLITPGSVKAARMAAGLGLTLVEQVIKGAAENGFALVRPPGHHARPGKGMGFCIFNNIAIAAKQALSLGIKRILIFDWDVHHGNGTQETFYDDAHVLFIDLHQKNLFPIGSGLLEERGQGKGLGFTVNVPLPESCRDADYLYAFENLVRPLALDYRPELILVSAGFDAHESDPLGGMNLTTEGYGKLAAKVTSLAQELCEGKVVFFLEGGYNPFFLAKNVLACVEALVNKAPLSTTKEEVHPYTNGVERLIKGIYDSHAKQNRKAP